MTDTLVAERATLEDSLRGFLAARDHDLDGSASGGDVTQIADVRRVPRQPRRDRQSA
jgi:hypothetical protein